jgi:hypothetical protein
MTDQDTGAGSGSSSQGAADSAGAVNAAHGAASAPPEFHQQGRPQPTNPDRARGHSPALDAREKQQTAATPQTVSIEGVDYTQDEVRQAIAHRIESAARKNSLPQSPDKYDIKNSPNFKPPEGVKFEWDTNDPLLKNARELAHKRGLDQESFSDFLDVYAANKISEQQHVGVARNAEMAKLGSAAPGRIDAIDTWLHARVGQKADTIVSQLKNFPHAGMVEMFEEVIRQFSGQGGADFNQSGRQHEDNTGKIPGYDKMSFIEKRAHQDALTRRGGR